ncbi:MAG: FG-GAP repeat protein [Acidobacteriota bacterium]|nr:FG-GAP repeat protein [Acidobacteriota bacterium]
MSLSFNRPIRPLARHRAWLALLCVVAVAATSSLPLRHTSTMAAGQKPRSASGNVAAEPQTEMPADLREAVERSRYRISGQESAPLPNSYQAMNPAQAFSATFTDAGLRVQPHSASVKAESADSELSASAVAESAQAEAVAGWQWGMTLRGYGYGEQMQEVAPAALEAADNRIEYRRGELTEWYVNDQRGLEQGFTLAARPAGSKRREPLVVRLSVEGDLRAEGSRDHQHIYFVEESGVRVLSYSGLVAFDARGKALAAQMRVAEGEVRLEVEDEGAEYPLTIDPLIALETKLTSSDAAAGEQFDISVAISDDTAVVGAPENYTAAGVNAGSVYVFVRSNGQWSQQVKLTASDAAKDDKFGFSVAISGDTAVVGVANWQSAVVSAYVKRLINAIPL